MLWSLNIFKMKTNESYNIINLRKEIKNYAHEKIIEPIETKR
jgi:hypothetical protein